MAQGVGVIKGQAAIPMVRTFLGRRQHAPGHHGRARGYDVATVGRDEATIRADSRTQEAEARRLDHMGWW
jgi:hypothetical protein